MKSWQRGEVATLLTIAALVLVGISTVVSSAVLKNKLTTSGKASEPSDPSGYEVTPTPTWNPNQGANCGPEGEPPTYLYGCCSGLEEDPYTGICERPSNIVRPSPTGFQTTYTCGPEGEPPTDQYGCCNGLETDPNTGICERPRNINYPTPTQSLTPTPFRNAISSCGPEGEPPTDQYGCCSGLVQDPITLICERPRPGIVGKGDEACLGRSSGRSCVNSTNTALCQDGRSVSILNCIAYNGGTCDVSSGECLPYLPNVDMSLTPPANMPPGTVNCYGHKAGEYWCDGTKSNWCGPGGVAGFPCSQNGSTCNQATGYCTQSPSWIWSLPPDGSTWKNPDDITVETPPNIESIEAACEKIPGVVFCRCMPNNTCIISSNVTITPKPKK